MWEYNHTPDEDELYHWGTGKFHKYIAKIGKGINAKYFYTQQQLAAYKNKANTYGQAFKEEAKKSVDYTKKQLNAYGKALSSKDEKKAYENADKMATYSKTIEKDGSTRTIYDAGKYARYSVYEKRKNYNRAKTLKGKAEDAKKVYENSNTAKAINKGKQYVEKTLKDYGNAISSKDEKKTYENLKKYYTAEQKGINKGLVDGEKKKTNENLWDSAERELNRLIVNEADRGLHNSTLRRRMDNAKSNYDRAKTLKGKTEDVIDTYKKRKKKK